MRTHRTILRYCRICIALLPASLTLSALPALLVSVFISFFLHDTKLRSQTTHIPHSYHYSRQRGLNPELTISQYVSKIWQSQQGLPQNSAYALCQTRDGYLWIGTEEGAARFDGAQFKIFDKESFIGLSVGYTIAFFEQRDGTFWIGTRGGGLIRLQNGKYTLFDKNYGIPASEIWTITEDRSGTLWIGTEMGVFAYSQGKVQQFTTANGLPHNTVYALHQDRLGTFWVGTEQGLCRLTADLHHNIATNQQIFTRETLPNKDSTDVRAILHDSKGILRVGTRKGLWSRSSSGLWSLLTTKDGLSGNYVYALLEDREGSVWVGMFDNGVNRIKTSGSSSKSSPTLTIEAFTRKEGLVNENVTSLLEDREGSVWIGTYGGGVQRLSNGLCLNMAQREGLVADVIRSFAEDSTGGFWIGTNSNGVQRLSNGKLTLFDKTTTKTLAGEEIRGLYTAPDGTVWVGVLGVGAYSFKNGKWRLYSEKDGLSSNDVYAIVQDNEGAIWFGGSRKGLSRLKDGKFTTVGLKEGLLNESIYALMPDRQGGIWLGSFGGGLQYYRNGQFTNYSVENGLLGINILTLYQDKQGAIWVGGIGGISRIKNGKVKSLTKAQGLFDDAAFTILEDDFGFLWATTNKGIYRLRKAQADSVLDGFIPRLESRHFGTSDGMRNAECNGGAQPSALRTKDGRLWFSTIESAVIIDPAKISSNPLPPPVIIESALADTLALNLQEAASLAPNLNKLQFQYTAPSLISAERVRFRYLLEGFDKDWTDAGTRRTAYYTNLPRGRDYRFRVQACNNDGVWNEIGAAYSFSTQQFFYETWWFFLLCAVSGGSVLAGAYRLRVRQVSLRAQELERLVQERTNRLQQIIQELAAANNEVQRQMELTDAQAREIEISNSQLQEANGNLQQLIAEKNEFLGIAAHDLKTPLSSIIMTISMLQRYTEKIDPKSYTSYLSRIESTAGRMLNIITDLLNINEIESGELRLSFQIVNLAELAADAAQHYQILAARKNIRFATDFPDQTVNIRADKDKLWEIMENLTSNALKFSPPNTEILITVKTSGNYARFEVHDQGPGISAEDQERLFEKFARLSAKPTAGEHSTGLGLSIVKKVTQAMRGRVWCESFDGHGATFIVEFPLFQEPFYQEP